MGLDQEVTKGEAIRIVERIVRDERFCALWDDATQEQALRMVLSYLKRT